jgi:Zn finger protein HypA/HybF involved in hydrogenase expression
MGKRRGHGRGTFRCVNCGQEIRLQGPVHIGPCTNCQGTSFRRVAGPETFIPE